MAGNGVAGVAGLPQGSNVNECDGAAAFLKPAGIAGNPSECRTLKAGARPDPEIVRRLSEARLLKLLKGGLPAFKRGRIFYDFELGKVRIASFGSDA